MNQELEPTGQSLDPMAQAVADLETAATRARTASQEAGSASAQLVPRNSSAPASVSRDQVAHQRAALMRAHQDATEAARVFKETLEAEIRAKLAQFKAQLAPLEQQVKQFTEVLWSLNLYFGRGEEIRELRDGKPAPADTPIYLRQMVLSMDQECALLAKNGGMDARNVDVFLDWLLESDEHLDQVLPEQRGVVVLVPRTTPKDYGDPWIQGHMNQANHQSFWLVRNGQRLYWMSTDFNVGKRLVPAYDEFTSFFRSSRYNPETREREPYQIEPGTQDWLKAEEAADARQRHFLRVGMILQGLVDAELTGRPPLFHPLPAPSLNLLAPDAYEAGHVIHITDAENALTTGRVPFDTWLRTLNEQLRPGMRIIGAFDTDAFTCWREQGRHERLAPSSASYPRPDEIYTIDRRTDEGRLVFKYQQEGSIWRNAPKRRASCWILPDDPFIIPIDLVDIPTMQAYLNARTERRSYIDMMPLLRRAIEVKQQEEAAEAPFRQLLAGRINAEHGTPVEEATAALTELVAWWKLANRWHRPLVTDEDPIQEAKAIKAIVTEYARRTTAAASSDTAAETAMVAKLRAHDPRVMVVARTRDGGYIALAPETRSHTQLNASVWVREYTTTSTGRRITERPNQIVGTRPAKWRILWKSAAWEEHDKVTTVAELLTDQEISEQLQELLEVGNKLAGRRFLWDKSAVQGSPIAVTYREDKKRFHVYLDEPLQLQAPTMLLTESLPNHSYQQWDAVWKRSRSREITVEHSGSPNRRDTRRSVPWEGDQQVLLWTDEEKVAEFHRTAAALDQAREASRALSSRSWELEKSIIDGWQAEAEEAARQRFLEDCPDPALWPGHKKTLRFNFPHHGSHWQTSDHKKALNILVERNIDPTGWTMQQAAEAAGRETGEPLTIPDDIKHLTIGAPANGS